MDVLVVRFTVHIYEPQDLEHRFIKTIDGEIGFHDTDYSDHLVQIGSLEAHLIHISGMYNTNFYYMDAYDCESAHLAASLNLLYDSEISWFRPEVIGKVGFDIDEAIEWHLNVTRLDIAPEHRGKRYGVRALRSLRHYVERSGLIVTAKAHPEPRDAPRKAPRAEVKGLRDYYLSEPDLGFRRVGHPTDGWLIANWSSL